MAFVYAVLLLTGYSGTTWGATTPSPQSVPVPACNATHDACTTDEDCSDTRDDLVCIAVGPPDSPGFKNCVCKDGYYGNPQEPCKNESSAAPIFGMYAGCFKVDKTNRLITTAAGDYKSSLLNTYSCREACSNQNELYAVLQEGDICFCSTSKPPVSEQADEEMCDSECSEEDPGDKMCGGFREIDGQYITESYSSIYTTQKGISSAWFVELEKSLETNVVVRAVLDYAPPVGFCKQWMNYLFDFGTGAGRTFPHPFTWIEWIYAYPGTFIVTGVADSRYPAIDATSVVVREPIRKEGVIAECSEVYRYGMKANCSVTSILGTGIMAKIYWGDKDRKEFDFSRIEDPHHCLAGSPVMQKINCADYLDQVDYFYDADNKLLFDPLYEFSCEGIFKGMEYYVKKVGSSSTITFKLYRPGCTSASQQWCFDTMTCSPNTSPCLPPFSYRCGDTGAYCQMGGGCVADQCARSNRSDSFMANGISYTLVESWDVTLDATCSNMCGCYGLFYVDLGTYDAPVQTRVYPGDVLVLDPGDNQIYYSKDENSFDSVFKFIPGNSLDEGSANSKEFGVKWAFRGFLAQPSSINLTNNLPTPDGTEPYEVEIWVTADKFGDEEDRNVSDTIDGIYVEDIPVYYFTFQVSSFEGFSNVMVTYLFEYHPYARVGHPYNLLITLDNPEAYNFGVELNITWTPTDQFGPVLFESRVMEGFTFTSAGEYEVCVSAKNVISFDRLCWTVDAYNPVPIDKYNVVFSDVNIGCPCGEQDADGDYLGDGLFSVTITMTDTSTFLTNFPTNATVYFIVDLDEDIVLSEQLDTSNHFPVASASPIYSEYIYNSTGCRRVGVIVGNAISQFGKFTKVCVYERMTQLNISKLVQIHPGQVNLEDPTEIPVDKYACEYNSDTNCAFYLNKDFYTRITLSQNSSVVNQTFMWHWGDDSEEDLETFKYSSVATHLFYFDFYGVENYRVLSGANITISTPLQSGNKAVVVPIADSDGQSYRIALPPSKPKVNTPGFVWKVQDTVEVTFAFTVVGWKTCCLTFCEGCTTDLGFLQSFYDDDQSTSGGEDPDQALEDGYMRCSNQSDFDNPWWQAKAALYMDQHSRQDSRDGVQWEGWEGDADDAQEKLLPRVVLENKIQIKPFFGTKQEGYTINYFCWNPIGNVEAAFTFSRKEPITCSYPQISIDYRGAEIFNPYLVYRKDRNLLTGNVILNCPETTANDKWWKCVQYDERTGQPMGGESEKYVSFPGNTSSELIIPKKSLAYGVHKCTLSVKMKVPYSTPEYKSTEFTYFKLLPYVLLGQMYSSLTSVELGYDQTLRLNPAHYSVDLDLDDGEFTDFKWYAKCGTETYPMLGEEYNNAYPPPLPIGRSPGFAGGVEGLGPGRIDCNVGFLDVTPALYDGMRNDMTCEFMAIFRKTLDPFNRVGKAIITITVKEYVPPTVEIFTGQGTPAEPLITPDNRAAQKINPIGTFRAMSQCTGATDCDKVTFEWYLGCIIPDLTEPVDYSDISNYENVTLSPDPELQPVERLRVDNRLQNIGVPMGLLKYQLGNKSLDCILSLHVCNERTNQQIINGEATACGWATMNLVLNEPPVGGSVIVRHAPVMGPGVCLENYMYFSFSYHNWTDPDGDCIRSYRIIQVSGSGIVNIPLEVTLSSLADFQDINQKPLYTGPENPYNEKVSFGSKSRDWKVVFCIRVIDCLGAYVFYCVEDRFENIPPREMSTCQNSTSYLSTTTRIPISTVTPLSGSGTVSSTSNASSSLNDDDVDDVTAERYPYTRELLSDDPYGTAEDTNDRLDLLEEAVDSNYSKYIAEGSVRNVSAFALNVLTQMTEIKEELNDEIAEIEDELELLGSQISDEFSEEQIPQLNEVLEEKIRRRDEICERVKEIVDDLLAGMEEVGASFTTAETATAGAAVVADGTNDPQQVTANSLGAAKHILESSLAALEDSEQDQDARESSTQAVTKGTTGIAEGARAVDAANRQDTDTTGANATTIGPMPEIFDPVTGTPKPLPGDLSDSGRNTLNDWDKVDQLCQENKIAGEANTDQRESNVDLHMRKKQAKDITGDTDAGIQIQFTPRSSDQGAVVKIPRFEYLLDESINFTPRRAYGMQGGATTFVPLFGVPGDYKVGGMMVRIKFSDDEGSLVQIPQARKAIDVHVPSQNEALIDSGRERKRGIMELGKETQFIKAHIAMSGDEALLIYAKYVKQVVNEFLCVFVRYGVPPFHDPTTNEWIYDFREMLPRKLTPSERIRHEGVRYPDFNVYVIENHRLKDSGTYHIGIRTCRENFDENYFDTPIITNKVFAADFDLNVWTQGCRAIGEPGSGKEEQYESRGCIVGSLSCSTMTECICMHLTSFAGSVAPLPPALDFSAMSYDFADMYPAYIVVFTLWCTYILLMIYARRQDRVDIAKLGFTPLPDNDPQDYYMYEMAVQTGMVTGAGTKSKVYFYLAGEQARSRIHVIQDPYRRILKRNSKDLFLLATPKSLGKLTSVRIWHDNSAVGQEQNWYCDYVAFRDVQSGEKTFFMAYRWWSLVNDDGSIDRTIDRTEPENMKQFRYMFAAKAREKLNDGHLYYSIFARPVESNFTRCQRCSCAMCILLLEFSVSAMYYQMQQSIDDSTAVWVGPIKFNLQELGVSLMATLFVLPPAILVVELFRRTKPFMSEQEQEDLDGQLVKIDTPKNRNLIAVSI
ncbi:uncharacterized protein LOC142341475 [Convolutriloba macropyga]|uniref:uncharacterized protein LOC142341475 n=1 Tax=Convolutriloba macropyga TaxID=536237 RepID=UPI003F5239E7